MLLRFGMVIGYRGRDLFRYRHDDRSVRDLGVRRLSHFAFWNGTITRKSLPAHWALGARPCMIA